MARFTQVTAGAPPGSSLAEVWSPPRSLRILGVRIDDVTPPEALSLLTDYADGPGIHRVVTPNPEMIMLAQGDPDFRALINTSSLCLPDGVGLLWAARLTGQRLRQVVPGSFVVPWLAERSAQREHRWFLLGGAQGVAPEVANRLTTRFPTLDVAGTFAGHAGPQHDDASCAAVRAAGRVDVLLVAYGSPRQEMWIARNQARLGVPLAIGVGGTFNFIAGRSFRPPDWLHRIHLYWLGRLISEPWRWRRQLALVRFCALVVRQAVRYRLRGIGEP